MFASVADGAEARLSSLSKLASGVSISRDAAEPIVQRGMRQLPCGGFSWSHDPAIYSGTAFIRMSHEDAMDFIERMPPQCLMLLAGSRTYPDIITRTEARKGTVRGLQVHCFPEENQM